MTRPVSVSSHEKRLSTSYENALTILRCSSDHGFNIAFTKDHPDMPEWRGIQIMLGPKQSAAALMLIEAASKATPSGRVMYDEGSGALIMAFPPEADPKLRKEQKPPVRAMRAVLEKMPTLLECGIRHRDDGKYDVLQPEGANISVPQLAMLCAEEANLPVEKFYDLPIADGIIFKGSDGIRYTNRQYVGEEVMQDYLQQNDLKRPIFPAKVVIDAPTFEHLLKNIEPAVTGRSMAN